MIVAIIAECNPPHTGHAYLIRQVRERFGPDTTVLLLMSGNYVQRGEPAIVDRYLRAIGALEIGADLVLELPVPYSFATAAIFATGAVSLLDNLGSVDILAFGSECGDLTQLISISDYLLSPSFPADLAFARTKAPEESYIRLRTQLLRAHVSEAAAALADLPNNILAIEYLSALAAGGSAIRPFTIKRVGSYHTRKNDRSGYLSASAIRDAVQQGNAEKISSYVKADFLCIWQDARDRGLAPTCEDKLSPMILSHLLRLSAEGDLSAYFDIDPSLAAKMTAALPHATDLSTFISLLKAKHVTDAHLRRSVWNAFFGVTSSDVHTAPAFTRLLASNARGKESLKYIKRHSSIPILSRPSDVHRIKDPTVRRAVQFADYADAVYHYSVPCPQPMANLFRAKPNIRE